MDITVVLPSLNPDEKLLEVVRSLNENGFDDIIVINDGSSSSHVHYFDEVKKLYNCTILTHSENFGKGKALKTGFNYYLEIGRNNLGVVTVDGDNQHKVEDIIACVTLLKANPEKLVLGCRDFSSENIPLKSQFGNKLTAFVLKNVCGIEVSDTQTGLRAFSKALLVQFLDTKGDRFEYETNMILTAKTKSIDIIEQKIRTIYIEENKSTHFSPLTDSISIYLVIIRFLLVSISTCFLDIVMFAVILSSVSGMPSHLKILFATIGARIISSLLNYTLNRKRVFKSKVSKRVSILKYYTLSFFQVFFSYGLVYVFSTLLGISAIGVKILVDFLLFFVSFKFQREWVFHNRKTQKNPT